MFYNTEDFAYLLKKVLQRAVSEIFSVIKQDGGRVYSLQGPCLRMKFLCKSNVVHCPECFGAYFNILFLTDITDFAEETSHLVNFKRRPPS